MGTLAAIFVGFLGWLAVKTVMGLYTIDQNERAVLTTFGRAQRIAGATTLDDPIAKDLTPEQRERYCFPQVRVIGAGGPYFKFPWQRLHRVTVATETMNMAKDLQDPRANHGGKQLEAVTKDQLNTGITGDVRYRVSERNLYAYLFGVKQPLVHVMGYFVSILRERIANFEAPNSLGGSTLEDGRGGVSINDLRKNLRDLNDHMVRECQTSSARYGLVLEASVITGIDPPSDVESALAAINTAHNHVSSDISLAQASADQKLVQSRRAVEIETLRAEAEVAPLMALADQLTQLKTQGQGALQTYRRNIRLPLFARLQSIILERS